MVPGTATKSPSTSSITSFVWTRLLLPCPPVSRRHQRRVRAHVPGRFVAAAGSDRARARPLLRWPISASSCSRDIFFLLFLPPLLFLDGWRIPKEGLFRDKGTILELALGLVVFTVVGVGYFINWMIPAMPLAVAFALAAIVSPTDPIAVSAIASRVPIPRRLMHILEGESLLNGCVGSRVHAFCGGSSLDRRILTPRRSRHVPLACDRRPSPSAWVSPGSQPSGRTGFRSATAKRPVRRS